MSRDRKFRYFMQQFIPRFYVISGLLTDLSQNSPCHGTINQELIDLFIKAVWVQTNYNAFIWSKFIKDKTERMLKSSKVYVTYVLFACQFLNDNMADVFESILCVASIVMTFSVNFYQLGCGNYHELSSKILIVFFENIIKEKFYQRGGWILFKRYISEFESLEYYENNKTFNEVGAMIVHTFTEDNFSIQDFYPYVSFIGNMAQDDVENNVICLQLAEEVFSQEESELCLKKVHHKSRSTRKSSAQNASKTIKDTLDTHTKSLMSNELENQNSWEQEKFDSPPTIKLCEKDESNFKGKIKECDQMAILDLSSRVDTATDAESHHQWDSEQNKKCSTSVNRDESITLENLKTKSPTNSQMSPQFPTKEIKNINKQSSSNQKYEISYSVQQTKENVNDTAEKCHSPDNTVTFREELKMNVETSSVVSNNEFIESEFLVLSEAKQMLDSLKKKLSLFEDMLNYLSE